jgi:DNA-binding CsgD family transcriptional regulator/tetratricopeptide (TPR) repeat protein
MTVERDLERGWAALQAGRWAEARDVFEALLAGGETAQAHDGLAEALWWLCEARASVRHRERAFVMLRDSGDVGRAGWLAVQICICYLVNLGNDAAARGWLRRAERITQELDPNPLQGWLLLMSGFLTPDVAEASALLARALEWARGAGDRDLELVALGDLGYALVAAGRAEEGMVLLDEAMAGTLGGEYRRLDTVVFTSCNMLAACHLTGDLARADQWCRVADEFMQTYACPFLFARCRVHYGSVLVARGEWARGEAELQTALMMAEDAGPGPRSEALARLADLRLCQGRIEEAQALLARLGDPAAAGLATPALHLARGEHAVAMALLHRRLATVGSNPTEVAATLAMLVDAQLRAGHVDGARASAERLTELADGTTSAPVEAFRAVASAHVAALADEAGTAVGLLEEALAALARLELPLETARTRLQLARVLAGEHPEVAVAEAQTALASFDRLGAAPDADAAAALLRSLRAPVRRRRTGRGPLTAREQEVLGLVGLGLSNPEIAERLFISRKTAAHHVSSILAKLGLRNRAEVVAHVTASGDASSTS